MEGESWDWAVVVGYTGLRVLRSSPRIPVFRLRIVEPQARDQIQREPINLCDAANGFLLADYSSRPLPPFEMREVDAGWLVGELYEVWRICIEYPAYQATVRMKWELPKKLAEVSQVVGFDLNLPYPYDSSGVVSETISQNRTDFLRRRRKQFNPCLVTSV